MDKGQFLQTAPVYYALAIAAFMRSSQGPTSMAEVQEAYSHRDDDNDRWYELPNDRLFERAVEWLQAQGLITQELDDFGPPLIEATEDFSELFEALCQGGSAPFTRYAKQRFSKGWLREALAGVTRREVELRIIEADFLEPDGEWEPIPLDRSEPTLQKAITSVDDVVEAVRADNGYAANVPEERQFVLDGLNVLANRLKTSDTVSIPTLRTYGTEMLFKLVRRFGPAALGVLASATLAAVRAWVTKQVGLGLDSLFR